MAAAGSFVTLTYPPDYKVSYSRGLNLGNTTVRTSYFTQKDKRVNN
jgi:hypothetical protein